MKPEEVLDNINNKILIQGRRNGRYLETEMMKVIIEALEKQIPTPPERRSDEYDGEYGYCPSCDRTISDYSDMRVCRNCGQKINWEETP